MPMPMQQPPQGGNPNMAAFMQSQGGQPPAPQGMGAPSQQPPQGMQQPPQQGGQPPQQGLDPKIQALLQQIAGMGRGGDTLLAHLTPGEMTVPKEVQTPKLMKELNNAYVKAGVHPLQFTAGSPQSSINPATGLHEYNFMSAFLPAALGIGGGMAAAALAPETGGMSLAAYSALGAGAGNATGSLLTGATPTQAALSGAMAAGGSYVGGGGLSASSAAEDAAKKAAADQATKTAAVSALGNASTNSGDFMNGYKALTAAPTAVQPNAMSALDAAMKTPASSGAVENGFSNVWGNAPAGSNPIGGALGGVAGGYMGNQLGAPPKSNPPNYPPGFNNPMDPVGSKGSAQQQLGMTNSTMPAPNFTGYNPSTNYPASYNFYPSS